VLAFALSSMPLLLTVLFMLGAQSTFFSPIKYAILPQHLSSGELIAGNALVEAGTFVAILIGSILGSLLIDPADYGLTVTVIMLAAALVGYGAARSIPPAPSTDPEVRVNPNFLVELVRFVAFARQNAAVNWGILGIAWFWTLGALYVSQLAPYTKSALGGDQTAVTLYLACFTVGIGAGALLCNYLLGARVSSKLIPVAAIGMSVLTTDLWLATFDASGTEELLNGWAILGTATAMRVA